MFGIRTSELIPLKREIGRGQKSAPNHPGKPLMTRLMTGAEGVDGGDRETRVTGASKEGEGIEDSLQNMQTMDTEHGDKVVPKEQ